MAGHDIKAELKTDLDERLRRFEERQLINAFAERERIVAAARRTGMIWAGICLVIAGFTVLAHLVIWRIHHAA